MSEFKDPVQDLINSYVNPFVEHNLAAKTLVRGLRVIGIGVTPVLDHITFRSLDISKRAEEFVAHGYALDESLGKFEGLDWFGQVYRKEGYADVLIKKPKDTGSENPILTWINAFGDKDPYNLAFSVEKVEDAVYSLEKQGVAFTGMIVGKRDGDLRQVYSKPETKEGQPYSVVELTERRKGFSGFIPEQISELIKSIQS